MASSHDTTLREARARYFRENGIEEDGGYAKNWVRIKLGPVPVSFPNTAGVRPHCCRTIFTTSPPAMTPPSLARQRLAPGNSRVAAATTMRRVLNLGAVAIGLFLAPGRVVRAFQRGWRCTNLYHLGVGAGWPEETVSRLRQRLRLHALPEERPRR